MTAPAVPKLVDEVLPLAVVVHKQHVCLWTEHLAREPVHTVVVLRVPNVVNHNDINHEIADQAQWHRPHTAEHAVASHCIAIARIAIIEQLHGGDHLVVPFQVFQSREPAVPRVLPAREVRAARVPDLYVGVLHPDEHAVHAAVLIEHLHMEEHVTARREHPLRRVRFQSHRREGQPAQLRRVNILVQRRPDVPLSARCIRPIRLVVDGERLGAIRRGGRPRGVEVVSRVGGVQIGDQSWGCADYLADPVHPPDVVVAQRVRIREAVAGEGDESPVLAPRGLPVVGQAVSATVRQRVGGLR